MQIIEYLRRAFQVSKMIGVEVDRLQVRTALHRLSDLGRKGS